MNLIRKIFLVVIVLLYPSYAFSLNDSFSFNQTDKRLHVVSSYALTITTAVFLEKKLPKWKSIFYASMLTMIAGTVKELALDDHYSGSDQIGNLLGVTGAALVIVTIDL